MKPKAASKDLFDLEGRLDDLELPEAAALVQRAGALARVHENMPQVVCLIGSTRFFGLFRAINYQLTLKGYIVLSIGCDTKSDEGLNLTEEDKDKLDLLHMWKIVLADLVFCINYGGYIGKSTSREIGFARILGKNVKFLEVMQAVPVSFAFTEEMKTIVDLAVAAGMEGFPT